MSDFRHGQEKETPQGEGHNSISPSPVALSICPAPGKAVAAGAGQGGEEHPGVWLQASREWEAARLGVRGSAGSDCAGAEQALSFSTGMLSWQNTFFPAPSPRCYFSSCGLVFPFPEGFPAPHTSPTRLIVRLCQGLGVLFFSCSQLLRASA